MVYNEVADGIFCIYCTLFCLETSRGSFVAHPFCLWIMKGQKAKLYKASSFRHSIENQESTITVQVDLYKALKKIFHQAVLMSIASAVLYCGRQCITLRGDVEDGKSLWNPGNFFTLWLLHKHLEAPAMRSATHLSPHTQNELISTLGKHIILKGIMEELNAAQFITILADEVTSHMASKRIGVQARIRQVFLLTIYVHCSRHCLNIVINMSCSLP